MMRRIPGFLLVIAAVFVVACGSGGSSDSTNTNTGGGTTQPPASAPAILLSTAAANFTAAAGGASPAAQSVTVSNGGTGTLSGLATGTITYVGQASGWLTPSLSGTTAPATLTLTPATGALLAGTYTASVPVTSTATGVTNSPQSVNVTLTIAAGAAARLIIVNQPAANTGTITPAVTVAIQDALGNVVTSSTASVTIALGTNTAGAVLGGTTTVSAVAGIATFSNLTVSKPGTGFTLVASSVGLTSATSTAFSVTSAVASTTLGLGQSVSFLTSPNFSTTLAVQAGAQYLIAVVNTDPSYTQTEGFSLTGAFATSAALQRVPAGASLNAGRAAPARTNAPAQQTFAFNGQLPSSMAAMNQMAQNHMAVLSANNQIYQRAGNPSAAWAAARAGANRNTALSALIVQTIGTVNKVYVRNSLTAGCGSVDSIGARTVAVGQHVIVLADTNLTKWPQAFRPDTSFYQTFATEYDQITFPHLIANIGNPLAYDNSLSSVGKVTVVITPTLNNLAGLTGGGTVVAFVNSCDFFPNRSAPIGGGFSNQTETFYSFVPATNGYSVATWEAQLRATAAHESKHIVSFADRIINNSPSFEEIWLEEGLAQESSEIWERNFNQALWLGNANFFQTVACEISLGAGAPCDLANNKPFALTASHLPFFFQYLQTESTSNGEGLGLDTPSNYGAGWTIARWSTDQYANGSEGAYIKSLINEPQLTGLANISSHTGQSIPLLLTYWNVATAIFQTPNYTAADVRITIPSFNFANIDSIGQRALTCSGTPCGIFSANGSPSPTFPVTPIAMTATGTTTKSVISVPGTSGSYFLLSASTAGIESLQLLTPGGAALSGSSGFRVAIVRVQ
jgi:hypothetical protein